jgi:superfamily II DNA or RNA helicase
MVVQRRRAGDVLLRVPVSAHNSAARWPDADSALGTLWQRSAYPEPGIGRDHEARQENRQTPIALRPYQKNDIDRLRRSFATGHRAPIYQLPTGGGKTVVFAEVTRSTWVAGRRVLVVVHRRELVKQASQKLTWAGVPHGIIAAGFPGRPDLTVQVCSIQTAIRRLEAIGSFDLIIFDEAHHCRAATYKALIDARPRSRLLGVTATPARLDGKGLGVHCGGCFDDLVCGPSIADLVAEGYLSPARYFAPQQKVDLEGVRVRRGDYVAAEVAACVDRKVITGDAVAKYHERADHLPAIAFCALVSHAEHVAEQFRDAGYRAACVHGEMSATDRDQVIAGLGTGASRF